VTEEGFVHGHFRNAGGTALLVEGRVVEDMMSAAMIDDAAGCAWSLNLQKKRRVAVSDRNSPPMNKVPQ
jgi:hypothetical protein